MACLAISQSRYLRMHYQSLDKTLGYNDNVKAVISLTTIPSRIRRIYPTLNSLLDQTYPTFIHLFIPKRANCEPTKQYILDRRISQCPRVRVTVIDEDTGPSLKFIPAIQQYQNHKTAIIVVDDDNVYPSTLVEKLLSAAKNEPHIVHAGRGWQHSPDLKWAHTKTIFSHKIRQPHRVAVITGCGGYIFSPELLSNMHVQDLVNYSEAPASAKLMDDIWISGHLSRWGIAKQITPGIPMFRPSMSTLFTPRHLNPARAAKNDEVIAYFRNVWLKDEIKS